MQVHTLRQIACSLHQYRMSAAWSGRKGRGVTVKEGGKKKKKNSEKRRAKPCLGLQHEARVHI
jgi:hypothetical protein